MITIDSLIGQMKNLFAIKTPVRFDTPEYIQFHSDLIQYIYENHFEESDEWKIISRNLVYTSTQRMAVGEGNTILIQLDALKRRELGLRFAVDWKLVHPDIIRVARSLYQDGHYFESARSAFIEINARVKKLFPELRGKDGKQLDGYLKVLCDELFGRSCFLASIVWQKRYSRENREAIGDSHEYILVYVKDKDAFKKTRNYLPLTEKQLKAYKNPDNDPRGSWQSVSLLAQGYRPNQMYEIVAPNGKIHTPPPGNCWKVIESEFKKALADGRVTFGNDGNGVPRRKQFLSEAKGIVPWTWWPQDEVGHTGESKDEVNALFGSDISFDTPKPERLIERIIHIATNPGDLVLDSFLGSGTTAAVAQKMGRRWIGVEMGNHAYTHCKVRADKVIAGQDPGGITKAQNWQGGGGYRFYEVAPTLINKDAFDEYVINEDYDANMLAAAVALHEGFHYQPDGELFWKQSVGNENSYLFVTTRHLNSTYLDSIKDTMEDGEYLIIACRSFDSELDKAYDNIAVKKIPQMLLERCEFGKTDYNLNIVHPPVYDDEEEQDV